MKLLNEIFHLIFKTENPDNSCNICYKQSIKSKGYCYPLEDGKIVFRENNHDNNYSFDSIFTGDQFIRLIRKKQIRNDNYRLVGFFINGYKALLGLNYCMFRQGYDWYGCIDIKLFKKICKNYEVRIVLDMIETEVDDEYRQY